MKGADITALGECLIDFTPAGVSESGMQLFERNPGGAPANVLSCASRLGRRTAIIGKVGADIHGRFLCDTMRGQNIDTAYLFETEKAFTTLAFVMLSETGERDFAFARKPGADTQLSADEVPEELLRHTGIFHVGSLSLTQEPIRSATLRAIELARKAGAIISYDPNYRPLLWPDEQTAVREMRSLLRFADAVKLSDEECVLLTGESDPEKAAEILIASSVCCVAVTLGADGALLAGKNGRSRVPGFSVQTVDTTGAGDAFWGAFLTRLSECGERPETLSTEQLRDFGTFACAAASLCVERRGAIPAMPDRAAVEARML